MTKNNFLHENPTSFLEESERDAILCLIIQVVCKIENCYPKQFARLASKVMSEQWDQDIKLNRIIPSDFLLTISAECEQRKWKHVLHI